MTESEILRISWFDLTKLLGRHRARMRFDASVAGRELEEPPQQEFAPAQQSAADRIAYLDRWVERTGGTNVIKQNGERATTRS